LKEALEKAGIRLAISPGDVVIVKDKEIKFPLEPDRKPHIRRFCVVLSSDILCEKSPITAILPLSHQVGLRSFADVYISKTTENGLEKDSYAVMEQIQPVRRVDIQERLGKLSLNDWEEILRKMVENFDRA
jgi:mRNA-degrading endonuclease toxin of MazEF toxin-antitoxin module